MKRIILTLALLGLIVIAPANAEEPLKKHISVSYSAKSPNFPKSLSKYSLVEKKANQTIRVFEGDSWSVPIAQLDPVRDGGATMSCEPFYWIIRWQSANKDVLIKTTAGITDFGFDPVYKVKIGGKGYMEGNSCVVPAFSFARAINGNRANLTDIYFEYTIWKSKKNS